MQVVIDIDEKQYNIIKNDLYKTFPTEMKKWGLEAIRNGIPLDKIRAEIADLDDADYDYEGYYKAVTDAVKIIDKYKAESEEEE